MDQKSFRGDSGIYIECASVKNDKKKTTFTRTSQSHHVAIKREERVENQMCLNTAAYAEFVSSPRQVYYPETSRGKNFALCFV